MKFHTIIYIRLNEIDRTVAVYYSGFEIVVACQSLWLFGIAPWLLLLTAAFACCLSIFFKIVNVGINSSCHAIHMFTMLRFLFQKQNGNYMQIAISWRVCTLHCSVAQINTQSDKTGSILRPCTL
jgi:glycerol-3-phosphate acyltransferase PlsY